MAPVAGGRGLQAQFRPGPGGDRLVRADRAHRPRPRHRSVSRAPAGGRALPHRSARAAEPVPHAFADDHVHDDQPLDPGPAHHARDGMSARRPRPVRKPVARTPVWVAPAAIVAGLAVLVAAFLVIRWYVTPLPPKAPSQEATVQIVSTITTLPASEFDSVGQGTANNLIKPITGTPLKGPSGKLEVFYYGAEFCPYCAAQRWPLIIAMSRFGTFSGLQTTSSSSSDVFPNTPTLTFRNATYSSQYLELRAVETTDRDRNPLQSPSESEQQLVNSYDPGGTIPFIDLAHRYAISGAMY